MALDSRLSVLHLAPHPDDELIGAPATLMGLRRAGHRVFNLACSLGSSEQADRRRGELENAMKRARFEWDVVDPPLAMSSSHGDDLELAQRTLADDVRRRVEAEGFELVISPSPHDGHPGHELVGRAARDAISHVSRPPPRWWMWSLWADLPLPTLYIPFGRLRMVEILWALSAHKGEVARNDYRGLVRGRSRANRVLGAERVFRFGAPQREGSYAELLTEVIRQNERWLAAGPRTPALDQPLAGADGTLPVDWWLHELSVAERARRVSAGLLPSERGS
jgi:LmbE family N-acetylglucosaminyl deacetylase